MKRDEGCTAPEMEFLIEDAISGTLAVLGREEILERFSEHIRSCASCRSTLVDHAHQTIVLPMLNGIAGDDLSSDSKRQLDRTAPSTVEVLLS